MNFVKFDEVNNWRDRPLEIGRIRIGDIHSVGFHSYPSSRFLLIVNATIARGMSRGTEQGVASWVFTLPSSPRTSNSATIQLRCHRSQFIREIEAISRKQFNRRVSSARPASAPLCPPLGQAHET
ncbi:hypothetical protein KQX54_006572 [Cotesia glomerata]|uniref:Uncharacterized protein n=1 Tax=Cotesia glomerata TaxID=32391 RepID=A0AAV7I7E1_COTGL|nr:hypothetical protein KQX54_006572 [Cotesia glomerata]